MKHPTTSAKHAHRQDLRQRRRALQQGQQQRAAYRIARALEQLPEYRRCHTLAAYLSSDGEVSCATVINRATQSGRCCYLPKIEIDKKQMRFYAYRRNQLTVCNRYQLREPSTQRRRPINPRQLDIVLLPLVGFDRQGHRLGMGGGYYDRAFAFKRQRARNSDKPLMIGLAHSVQEVARLPAEAWDIPLDVILTERETIRLRRR